MVGIDKIDAILKRMEEGNSERSSCKAEGVNRATFRAAVLREKMAGQYAKALECLAYDQIETLENTIQEMRDGKLDPQIGRIEVDARKWFASKFLPKQFGERIDHTTNGKDLPTPILGTTPYQLPTDTTSKNV